MGNPDRVALDGWSVRQAGHGPVGLFLSPGFANHDLDLSSELGGLSARTYSIQAAAPIPASLVENLVLAVVEVDPATPGSIDRLSSLVSAMPDVPVVAAISAPDVAVVRALVRQGVADVVALPIQARELEQIVLDVLARQAGSQQVKLCPMIGVVKASGGAGATTTATQLTSKLADFDWDQQRPVLVDLDVQFGSVREYLGLDEGNSVLSLVSSEDRLDDALLGSVLALKDGFAVLRAPEEIVSLSSVNVDDLIGTLDFVRAHHGVLVVDLPANWSDWSLSLATGCDLILLVTELSLPGLRQAKKLLHLFEEVGVDRARIRLVFNKVEKRLFSTLKVEDAVHALRIEALASLPLEPSIAQAQQDGLLIDQHARRSRYAQELTRLGAGVRACVHGRIEA